MIKHLLYMPMTGLGLYNGHRGNRWLKNRIKIFKQFVLPSLKAQTNKNFILWISGRREDKNDPLFTEFVQFLKTQVPTVATYSGVCFWDDKYPDEVAHERLVSALHGAMGEVINAIGECDDVLMTIQPSDDVYRTNFVEEIQWLFAQFKKHDCIGYQAGYVMDYLTGRVKEWNPKTTPPFYTIRFKREVFIDPFQHMKYTGPYKSHEYVKDFVKATYMNSRGFLVGTHSSNISTVFDHPYAGAEVSRVILKEFGLENVENLKLPKSIDTVIFKRLPYSVKRKLRYLAGEKKSIFRPVFSLVYNILRS